MKKLIQILAGCTIGIMVSGSVLAGIYTESVGASSAAKGSDAISAVCQSFNHDAIPLFNTDMISSIKDFSSPASYAMKASVLTSITAAWKEGLGGSQSGVCYSGATCTSGTLASVAVTEGVLEGCAVNKPFLKCQTGASACTPGTLNAAEVIACPVDNSSNPKEAYRYTALNWFFPGLTDQTELVTRLQKDCGTPNLVGVRGLATTAN